MRWWRRVRERIRRRGAPAFAQAPAEPADRRFEFLLPEYEHLGGPATVGAPFRVSTPQGTVTGWLVELWELDDGRARITLDVTEVQAQRIEAIAAEHGIPLREGA